MYSMWLAGLLVLAATDANRTERARANLDMTGAVEEDVDLMLGWPGHTAKWGGPNWRKYHCVDWLGGRRIYYLEFKDGIVVAEERGCVEPPPWLNAIRDAFAPHPAP